MRGYAPVQFVFQYQLARSSKWYIDDIGDNIVNWIVWFSPTKLRQIAFCASSQIVINYGADIRDNSAKSLPVKI